MENNEWTIPSKNVIEYFNQQINNREKAFKRNDEINEELKILHEKIDALHKERLMLYESYCQKNIRIIEDFLQKSDDELLKEAKVHLISKKDHIGIKRSEETLRFHHSISYTISSIIKERQL